MSTLFVISGPSGAGKSVLIRRILDDLPAIRFSVSSTTRGPRPGETEGIDYHFISREQFQADIEAARFLEHAQYSGNLYGTNRHEIEEAERLGQDLLLDIEVQGARQLQEKGVEAVYIFVAPPSFAELERRLRSRNTEDEVAIQRRLRQSVEDVSHVHRYQFVIVNDNLEEAYSRLRSIFIAERSRRSRMGSTLEPILASFQK
ncbi:MAG: guanylate kinase [Bryobacterales bacterium]|nr:guanylate kinase [Bryobacterales bacterium]